MAEAYALEHLYRRDDLSWRAGPLLSCSLLVGSIPTRPTMKYIIKQSGNEKRIIPVGDPPEDKIIKSDIRKYQEIKKELVKKMSWTQENQ